MVEEKAKSVEQGDGRKEAFEDLDGDGPVTVEPVSESELRGWLALGAVRGLSGHGAVGLVARYGTPAKLIEACRAGDVPDGVRPKLAAAIAGYDDWKWVDAELEAAQKAGVTLLAYSDPRYPRLLKEIPDPPHLLYVRGHGIESLGASSVGLVGTRQATGYGRNISERIAHDLSLLGIVVISGGARGCDSAAHRGVLKAGGTTIAVFGTGVDIVYPKEHARLYEEILDNGLLVSEFPMSTPPTQYNFPRRNRIISGLSLGILIAEAPARSGALMTARFALEQNREVFAVPGSVVSDKSKGTNRLLKEGAALVESAADIVEALSLRLVESAYSHSSSSVSTGGETGGQAGADFKAVAEGAGLTPSLSPDESLVCGCLGTEPVQIDAIIDSTGMSVAGVSTVLLALELKGLVEQRPGKFFVKKF